MNSNDAFEFGDGRVLIGLWALVPLAGLLVLSLRRRAAALARLGALVPARVSAAAVSLHQRRLALLWAAVGLLILALSRPTLGYRYEEVPQRGLDLVIVLDVSRSMSVTDVSPSRMERAQREVLDLAELIDGDRVGLVLFAGGAWPRMPLTVDYGALRFMVRDSEPNTLLSQGSDLGAGIDEGLRLLGTREEADQALVIISDGEDHEAGAIEAAKRAAEAGVRIFAMGVGSPEGAPIPTGEGGGFVKDEAGQVVLSRLDEGALQTLAAATGGAYVRSRGDATDVTALYQDELRGKLSAGDRGVRREKIGEERFMWFIGGAFLLLVLGAGLRPGALRLSGAVAGLIFCVGLARAAEDWKQEVERLASEQASKPDDLGLAERLGEALFRAGDYDRAQEVLEGVAERSVDPAQRQRARYNGGLAAYRGGQLTRALEDWQRIQQDNPEHAAAKQNAEAVQKELSARTQPPEEQPQQGQPGEGEPQEGQEGQPQEGQPQEGQQGQPQSGEQSQDGAQPADPGEGQPTEEGQPPIGERGEIEGEAGTAGEDAAAGEPTDANGDITAREAERLLDGVQEGSPRIRTSDRPRSGKDW